MIFNPRYWSQRLSSAGRNPRHSVFRTTVTVWDKIEAKHREHLKALVSPYDSILDVGCGYGRLIPLLPETWNGRYLGVDLCEDFIVKARNDHPTKEFICADFRTKDWIVDSESFTLAILVSIRGMVLRENPEEWPKFQANLKRLATRVLYLEYGLDAPPVVDIL